jgi:hypothetical protein
VINHLTTINIKTCTFNGYTITDCPGFGDLENKNLFYEKIKEFKDHLLEHSPYDALFLVIKFEIPNEDAKIDSPGFDSVIDDFLIAFDEEGLRSLILLCIQNQIQLPLEDFDPKLKSSKGYQKLKQQNKNFDIPFVLWDNFKPEYNQLENFTSCLNEIPKFTENAMKHAFVLTKRFLESPPIPPLEPRRRGWLDIILVWRWFR